MQTKSFKKLKQVRYQLRHVVLIVFDTEIAGGQAVAAVCSAEEGETIVKAAVDAFGTVHVLVANAGILRDKAFVNMDEKMWDQVIQVHMRGTFKVSILLCCHLSVSDSSHRLSKLFGQFSRSKSMDE